MTNDEIAKAVEGVENVLDERERRLWERIRIPPVRWGQRQYPDAPGSWVIGVQGTHCLYLNEVEEGWGWGRYVEWGTIAEYHWEEHELRHVIAQALDAIDGR